MIFYPKFLIFISINILSNSKFGDFVMKKKTALIAGLLIMSIAIIVLSFFWPPVDEDQAAGTFTKTEKYKENNVNKDDIILDSKILQDSVQVNKLISDLVQFGEFSQYLKAVFNQFWLKELDKMKSVPEINSAINQIKDFNNFIDNNNQIVQGTIVKFVDYNFTDKQQLDDIESQLKQLQNYIAQFLARDSIFEFTVRNVDLAIKNRLVKQDQINNLKNLRDKFVIDQFMYGLKIGDTVKVSQAISQDLYNPKTSLKQLDLGVCDRVNSIELGAINSYWENVVSILAGSGYNQNQLQLVGNSLNLDNALSTGFTAQNTYFAFNQENLGIIFNQDKINAVASGQSLGSVDDGWPIIVACLNSKVFKGAELTNNQGYKIIFSDANSIVIFNQLNLGLFLFNSPLYEILNLSALGVYL